MRTLRIPIITFIMNLLAKNWLMAFMAFAVFTIISCEDPGEIGLQLDPNEGVLKTYYQELTLPSTVVQFAPQGTAGPKRIYLGKYNDPEFGLVEGRLYSNLGLNMPSTAMDGTATYDGFEMRIQYSGSYGAINNTVHDYQIFELDEWLSITEDPNRLRTLNTKGVSMADWQATPATLASLDSLSKTPEDTIQLSDVVGLDLFNNRDVIFANKEAFQSYFKGIVMLPTNTTSMLSIGSLSFALKYKQTVDGEVKSFSISMPIDYEYLYMDSDKTGTPLSGLQPDNMDFDPGNGYRYIQSGLHIALKVDYSEFFNLVSNLDHMIINKAELHLGEVNYYEDYLTTPTSLYGYLTDANNSWPAKADFATSTTDTTSLNIMLQVDQAPPGNYLSDYNAKILPNTTDTLANGNAASYQVSMVSLLQNAYVDNFKWHTRAGKIGR